MSPFVEAWLVDERAEVLSGWLHALVFVSRNPGSLPPLDVLRGMVAELALLLETACDTLLND